MPNKIHNFLQKTYYKLLLLALILFFIPFHTIFNISLLFDIIMKCLGLLLLIILFINNAIEVIKHISEK